MQKTIQLVIMLTALRSYSKSIPPTFENKLRCYKQRFGKIAGGEQKYDKGLNDIAVVVAAE